MAQLTEHDFVPHREPQIWIPSRGRAGNCKTAKLLEADGVAFTILIEPQEEAAYREEHPHASLCILDEGGKGLPYALEELFGYYRRTNPNQCFIRMDDDITGFKEYHGRMYQPITPSRMIDVMMRLYRTAPDKIGQISLEFPHLAWTGDGSHRIKWNTSAEVCILYGAQAPEAASFDIQLPTKCDRDMNLQLLSAGLRTARLTWIAFDTQPMGEGKGGCSDSYADIQGYDRELQRMLDKWPGIANIRRKKRVGWDLKIDFSALRLDTYERATAQNAF